MTLDIKGARRAPAWRLDAQGVLESARQCPSPNCDERPPGASVELLVVHNISLPPGEFAGDAVARFFTTGLDPGEHPYFTEVAGLKVSAHFFIRRDGELIQFVPCARRAWHAGQSEWRGRSRCNDFSIGIELEGSDFEPFTDAQYGALNAALAALAAAYPLRAVRGHNDVAADRKTDPGPFFEWSRVLVPAGVSLPASRA